jgi:hypothetical protein
LTQQLIDKDVARGWMKKRFQLHCYPIRLIPIGWIFAKLNRPRMIYDMSCVRGWLNTNAYIHMELQARLYFMSFDELVFSLLDLHRKACLMRSWGWPGNIGMGAVDLIEAYRVFVSLTPWMRGLMAFATLALLALCSGFKTAEWDLGANRPPPTSSTASPVL